jgi:hypothetical protein
LPAAASDARRQLGEIGAGAIKRIHGGLNFNSGAGIQNSLDASSLHPQQRGFNRWPME